jgi:3-oxoacyl-[acyl-carrier protein] reductase
VRLEGKTAIITGGGRGIGLAYAQRFLHEGAAVVIADVNPDIGAAALEALSPLGEVSFVPTDVSREDSAANCMDHALERHGGIDILVNNAALYGDWDTSDQSLGYLRRMFDVNLHGVWIMARAAVPHMIARGGGRIVNQSSGAAYNYSSSRQNQVSDQVPSFPYHQTKWGVIGLTKYLAGYLGQWGITVNCVAPGVVATDATMAKVAQEHIERLAAQQALPGVIQPDDLCGAVVFFASDDVRFITGQVLVVDGGRHMPA